MKTHYSRLRLATAALLLLPVLAAGQVLRKPIQYFRPYDQRGVNVFETPKQDTVKYEGFAVRVGAAFTQQYQGILHQNSVGNQGNTPALPNQLIEIAGGFNLATANLNLDVQLAEGIRVHLISYLSSRHHPEAWVKGGYLQVDRIPFWSWLDPVFDKYLTLKVGHYEVNYGDQHFRRSDNGQTVWNPFVEGLIMDAFATEIGGELYFQHKGFLAMIGATDGEIQGGLTRPRDRRPNIYTKLGYDKQINDDLRVRLSGSLMSTASSIRNTLYAGDRAGSRYYMVLEPTTASVSANFTSGRINPDLSDMMTAYMINPFVKYQGFELFGAYEVAEGRSATDIERRKWQQYAVDLIYRFGAREQVYVGGRYNSASGRLPGAQVGDVTVNRYAFAAGWFITPAILLKAEWVNQEYKDFLPSDIRAGGKFSGLVIEGAINF